MVEYNYEAGRKPLLRNLKGNTARTRKRRRYRKTNKGEI